MLVPNICKICGRALIKTAGPIGPVCLRRLKIKNVRSSKKTTRAEHNALSKNMDIFGGY